jgi:hypothetical protein
MEAHLPDQALGIVGCPADVRVQHHCSVNNDLHMPIGIAAGVAFNILVYMIPLSLVQTMIVGYVKTFTTKKFYNDNQSNNVMRSK